MIISGRATAFCPARPLWGRTIILAVRTKSTCYSCPHPPYSAEHCCQLRQQECQSPRALSLCSVGNEARSLVEQLCLAHRLWAIKWKTLPSWFNCWCDVGVSYDKLSMDWLQGERGLGG